ncbi:hypothetical protein JN06_01346 [Bacteroides zoogleoformans]|uniref:Uncharacterized protein n=1 Tax=Bacteroides zoogleoformans TaxID=28119 RepID=A0ABM6T8Y8_9BACE|nr:hypothetical protein [Bacteroides zoogleoformans]AVM53313.1 hypothetical protein C4H11_10565 [Bacteroides zoogleoformans]TWJ14413.1 hypothetical protein JN06_01346 [Bacteroides zoogleoformans]
MDIRLLQQLEAETISEKPLKIPFSFDNIERLPKGKSPGDCIVIRPITVRTWFCIRPLLLKIDKEDLSRLINKPGEVGPEVAEVMDKYGELILDIVCLGIHNKPSDPPAWFRDVLTDNCTWQDIHVLLNAILFRIGFYPFCKSIITLRSVSPMDEAEMIAARKNLESWHLSRKEDS